MKFAHNQICTTGSKVSVGDTCQYKEDGLVMDVKVLSLTNDDEGIGFELEILNTSIHPIFKSPEKGTTIEPWAKAGHYAYSGMWRIYDAGAYFIANSEEDKDA